ncbi:hypothetical protein AVEN_93643-1 [Araneus ventricosus]|uniref:Uncharacterized protein n=1 Tax=Araneus ventricosus TaxID=182803 RepID=A0A4Y2SJU3_ARAVE|nr:hypothetical protein AVEN_23919-1 [Araneus ventricosus]GBN88407.1 hypothetical protein AVEN_93643-1 [Araneus ventricosus]
MSTTTQTSHQVIFISSDRWKKLLACHHFGIDAEVQEAVMKCLRDVDADFFYAGFDRLVYQLHKRFNNRVEKSQDRRRSNARRRESSVSEGKTTTTYGQGITLRAEDLLGESENRLGRGPGISAVNFLTPRPGT